MLASVSFALVLSGCMTSPRKAEPTPEPAPTPALFKEVAKPKSTPKPVAVRKPAAEKATEPTVVVSETKEETAPPANMQERLERVSRLLGDNQRISAANGQLIVSQQGTQPVQESPALFEEAILLNKLRGNLKSVPELQEQVVSTASVQKFTALLKMNSEISAATAAAAIKAAMRTDGINEVRADFGE